MTPAATDGDQLRHAVAVEVRTGDAGVVGQLRRVDGRQRVHRAVGVAHAGDDPERRRHVAAAVAGAVVAEEGDVGDVVPVGQPIGVVVGQVEDDRGADDVAVVLVPETGGRPPALDHGVELAGGRHVDALADAGDRNTHAEPGFAELVVGAVLVLDAGHRRQDAFLAPADLGADTAEILGGAAAVPPAGDRLAAALSLADQPVVAAHVGAERTVALVDEPVAVVVASVADLDEDLAVGWDVDGRRIPGTVGGRIASGAVGRGVRVERVVAVAVVVAVAAIPGVGPDRCRVTGVGARAGDGAAAGAREQPRGEEEDVGKT